MEEVADVVKLQVPCRADQVNLLQSLMGKPEEPTVPSLFIYGHTATGKSAVTNTMLEETKVPHVVVNCVECYTARLVFEHILNSLSATKPSPANQFACYAKCDNMNDFIRLLKQLVKEEDLKDETLYIVLDKAERLRDMPVNLLPAMLRLQELTDLNLCVMLVSEIVWEKFRFGTGFMEPFIIQFPDYSKDELLEIMALDCPAEYTREFYQMYCNLLLSVFHLVCRDLTELRHLAVLNFPKYVEPVLSGEATISDTRKLWRNIESHLKKALQTVYLREVSSAQWEKMQLESADEATTTLPSQASSTRANIELPYYSKYLLIAAYLASYNPVKSDKRFFTKRCEKMTKRSNLASNKKSERTSSQLLGPKPFPLDRLMAIFYSIVEGKVAPTANIFSQIQSLETLGFMAPVASNDQLDSPKYKCLVSLDLVKSVSRTVNFEVLRYLYDFV